MGRRDRGLATAFNTRSPGSAFADTSSPTGIALFDPVEMARVLSIDVTWDRLLQRNWERVYRSFRSVPEYELPDHFFVISPLAEEYPVGKTLASWQIVSREGFAVEFSREGR